jgi:amino acid adenylation domain-containing protein
MTYGELDTRSNKVARLLKDAGCRPGDRVAQLVPKCPMAIVGLLGIYKADAVYVPLDPSSPASRLQKILDSCENRWLLAGGPVTRVLEEILRSERLRESLSIGWLEGEAPAGDLGVEFTSDTLARCSGAPVISQNRPADAAHILFTSGSSGTPKGVVISHASVGHLIQWATRHFAMDASDRMSGHPPLHFDMSFFDLFCAAATGAELHLVPPGLNALPNKLAGFTRASGITQWFSVPSVLSYMAKFDVVRFNDFPALRRVLWAGDVLPTPVLVHWMERLPHVSFTNLYGPTETTIVSSHYTVPACPKSPHEAIPIGAACDGEELIVLDESLRPLDPGETGELHIGGVGLSSGYWRDPVRTDAAFVDHPQRQGERLYKTGDLARIGEDGLVYFLGRRDSQIKSRGYRIELGEIEAALAAIRGMQECAVVALTQPSFEGARICCAYSPAPGHHIAPAPLRRALSRLLPSYMLPTHWLALDALPTNANGKIDRRRLREVFEERVHADAAPTG